MVVLHPRCAGLDVPKDSAMAAVRIAAAGGASVEVRRFETTTPGLTDLAIAERLGVARATVATWRGRFAERRLDGLSDGWKRCFQPSWRATDRHGREGGRGGDGDAGDAADRADPLEFARDGQGRRARALHGAAHLAVSYTHLTLPTN